MTVDARPWFHGGVRGLQVGDLLLPPALTGVVSCSDAATTHPDDVVRTETLRVHSNDRVYLTADPRTARLFAMFYAGSDGTRRRGGDIYQAEPLGDTEPDPDYLADDGGAVAVPRARIVKVLARAVVRDLERMGMA